MADKSQIKKFLEMLGRGDTENMQGGDVKNFLRLMGRMTEDDYVTADEFYKMFNAVLTAVKQSAINNKGQIEGINKEADKQAKKLEGLFKELLTAVDARMKKVKDGEKGKDGRTPVAGLDYPNYQEIRNFIKDAIERLPKPKDPTEVITPQYVKNALIELEGNDRLPWTAVEGLEDKIDEFVRKAEANLRTKPQFVHGGVSISGGSGGGASTLDELTDVVITAPSNNQLLKYNGSEWVNATVAGTGDVVKVGTPVDGQLGVWTGDGTIEGDSALTFDTTTDSLVVGASGKFKFGAVTILDDTAGTTTLSNIDAVDATTISTLEGALGFAPALGADDNYVTDAQLVVIGNTSGTNTGDNAVNTLYSGLVTNATHTGEVTGSGALTLDKTAISNKADTVITTSDVILFSDATDTGNLKSDTVQGIIDLVPAPTPEGTAIKSTGETGGTKFLREDGDGTCSWQTVPAGSGDVSKVGTPADNQIGVWTGDGTIEGTAGLTFATNVLGVGTGASGTVSSNGDFDLILKTGNATTGNITITDGANGAITLAPNGTGVTQLYNADAGSTGAVLELYHDSASPAANDTVGKIMFYGEDSASNKQEYGAIATYIDDTTSTSEDATLALSVVKAGTTGIGRSALLLKATSFSPENDDSIALGTTTARYSDLFLAEGGVINWDNGDVTLTQSGNTLTLDGGNLVLAENSSIQLDTTLSGDEKWTGITQTVTSGSAFTQGDLCFLASDGKWDKTDGILDGTDTAFKSQLGIALATASGVDESIEMLLYGKVRSATFPAFTVGAPVYMDDTAGDVVVTQPSTTNFAIRVVGYALTAEDLMFAPSPDYIVHV